MKTQLMFVSILAWLCSLTCQARELTVSSPNGRLVAVLEDDDMLMIAVPLADRAHTCRWDNYRP